jgi:large subunit ribosomal protein L25
MSDSFDVTAQPRADKGKGASRRLRRAGLVPAVVYGGRQEPEMISLNHNELVHQLEQESFYSQVLNLKVENSATSKVVLKDLQRHPSKPFILHADFQRVSADEKIRMVVPLHFDNESSAKGVKAGGAVSHNLTEVEITCLPKDLPAFIAIDMAPLDIGDMVHLSELPLPSGVELAHAPDPDVPVVIVHGARPDISEEPEEEAGEEEEAPED